MASPKLWSPSSPHLYDLEIALVRGGRVLDRVTSYAAMRKFSTGKDRDGIVRLRLNDEPLFQFGPLDQGWWPDGLYTAPTDEALVYDIEKTREWGFNMIRKHIKVEPARVDDAAQARRRFFIEQPPRVVFDRFKVEGRVWGP